MSTARVTDAGASPAGLSPSAEEEKVAARAERWLRERLGKEHPLPLGRARAVAEQVQAVGLDDEAVAAAWMCGPGAEFAPTASDVAEATNAEVAALVEAVRRVASVRWHHLEDEQVEPLRKAFVAIARDVRGVIIALALRLQELRERAAAVEQGTLERAAVRGLAQETLEVHASLANRLGVWRLKWPLEDCAFRLLDPATYSELDRLLAESSERRENYVAKVVAQLRAELEREGLKGRVTGRPKHIYSVFRKMQRKQVSFEQIYDLSAVRVITEKVQDCYAVLGLVHSLWVPIPHELDDYIAMPKGNGYQSLHTAVIGPDGRAVEIQIRTEEMHRFAEYGVAAHWAYKEGKSSEALGKRFTLLRQLMEMDLGGKGAEGIDSEQLAETLRAILFTDQVFVFTPKGDVIELPEGSTALDFAYRVHTEVGHRCKGARVNDQIAPLDTKLKTGDRIEILTHREAAPSRDWMVASRGFLMSARARAKVRAWFREHDGERALEAPRAARAEPIKADAGKDLGAKAALSLRPLSEVGLPPRAPGGIVLDDVEQVLGQRANCCLPLPGDDVVGFITRGRGLTLHRRDCAQLVGSKEPERMVQVRWGSAPQVSYGVEVHVDLRDGEGSFPALAAQLAQAGLPLTAAEQIGGGAGEIRWRLRLDLRDAVQERKALTLLKAQPGVSQVRRV